MALLLALLAIGLWHLLRYLLIRGEGRSCFLPPLEEVDDGIWSMHFCQVLLGRVDERDYIIRA